MKLGTILKITSAILIVLTISIAFVTVQTKQQLPESFSQFIKQLHIAQIGNVKPNVRYKKIDGNTTYVSIIFHFPDSIRQDDWQVNITPAFTPSFHWSPHLTPTDNHVIDQHVFRTPAMIVADGKRQLTVIPDVEIIGEGSPVRWYMDVNAKKNVLTLGMSKVAVTDHVLFEKAPGAIYLKGEVEFGFYLIKSEDKKDLSNPFRKPLAFFWEKWGNKLYRSGNPSSGDLILYVEHTYNWAFNTWEKYVWQEFMLEGKKVGAPCFIVNTTQSPNYQGEPNFREFLSVWNQAWFSSLRSASGLYRYAKRTGNEDLLRRANLTKELALAAPKKEGFFYGLIATEMEEVTIAGKPYRRAKGWDTYYWGNSNRNPYTWDPRQAPFHVLDMSWTALLMLRWYDELDKDERLLSYARDYADALLKIQDDKGYFPAWLDLNTLKPMAHLNNSPETSLSATFLLKLYELTKDDKYRQSALKAIAIVSKEIVPTGRWEDFETYWSCSRWGSDGSVGKKIERNNMYKQCNFSMFWTAEALLEAYKITNEKKYLHQGQRVLDELLMTQASWQPSYIYVKALGGFGVLNTDGEWNDSRASLFAEIIIRYGKEMGNKEYIERGGAALRSAFTMMYCPENPITKKQWEKVWPFFNENDYGFTMENYGHGGRTTPEGEGMGEFTIYDWGNGAAAEAYNRLVDHNNIVN